MSRPLKVVPPRLRAVIPELAHRPDLQLRYEREIARAGCTGCHRGALLRKYIQLARKR